MVLPDGTVTALNALYGVALLVLAVVAGRRRTTRAGAATLWLGLLSLAAMRSGGAWADDITTTSLWVLCFTTFDALDRPRALAATVVAWVFLALLPGIVPLPALPGVPLMMVLSLVGFGLALAVGVRGALATEPRPEPALRPAPLPSHEEDSAILSPS